MVVDPSGPASFRAKTDHGEIVRWTSPSATSSACCAKAPTALSARPTPPTTAARRRPSRYGFSAAIWKQFADLGWLALPIAEEHGGLGGGAIEDRHPDGSVRARAGVRALSLHRRDRRRPDCSLRQRGAESGVAAESRRRLALSCLRPCRARRALRSRQGRDDGDENSRRLASQRSQDRSARRPGRGPDHRLRAPRQRQRFFRKAWPVPGAGGNIRHDPARLSSGSAAAAPAASICAMCNCPRMRCSATAAMHCPRSRRWSIAPWQRSARRPSASCRRCSTPRWNTPRSESSSAGRCLPTR